MFDSNQYQKVMEALHDLADAEFQERVWGRGEGPEVFPFAEAVCGLYDDTGLAELLIENETGETVISPEVDSILRELNTVLHGIDSHVEESAILKHPTWPKVQKLAAHAWQLMDAKRI